VILDVVALVAQHVLSDLPQGGSFFM